MKIHSFILSNEFCSFHTPRKPDSAVPCSAYFSIRGCVKLATAARSTHEAGFTQPFWQKYAPLMTSAEILLQSFVSDPNKRERREGAARGSKGRTTRATRILLLISSSSDNEFMISQRAGHGHSGEAAAQEKRRKGGNRINICLNQA